MEFEDFTPPRSETEYLREEAARMRMAALLAYGGLGGIVATPAA